MKDFSALIGQMTVPEKLAQMTQLMGNCFVTEGFGKLMGISYGFDIPEELAWNIGSVLAMSGARKLREVQKSYLEHNRNKIPLLFMHDVIHGFRTIFPVPLAMACSFDPKLAEQAASIAAKEAAVSGLHVTFSPYGGPCSRLPLGARNRKQRRRSLARLHDDAGSRTRLSRR